MTSARPDPASGTGRATWAAAAERGSRNGLRFLGWCVRRVGDAPIRPFLVPIALYYLLFDASSRRASRSYLRRIERARGHDEPPGWLDTYRHLLSFAQAILDRLALWAGAQDDFEIAIHGLEDMERHLQAGRGAFLVGAHLGSFDVLRVVARKAAIPVNVLMHTANAEKISETLEILDPGCNVRVIEIDPSSARTAFEIRKCLARGEFVAVLADRQRAGGRNRVSHVSFLGERAPFPEGPFLLPMVMRVPIVLSLGIRTGPRRYDIYFENLSEGEAVPARERAKRVQEHIEVFAARLEHYCLREPLQWFNFYDFWDEAAEE